MIKYVGKMILRMLPKKIRVNVEFYYYVGYWPNIKAPKTFNEKINNRKMSLSDPIFSLCSDKYKVRDYVESKVGRKYLIPLKFYGELISKETLDSIDGDFVVKTTHDSGSVQIIKKSLGYKAREVIDKVNLSLEKDFGKLVDESWYSDIKPRVIIEELLVKKDGSQPEDYKFHVFNDKVILQIDYDRFSDHSRSFYDEKLNLLPFGIKYKNKMKKIKELNGFNEMLHVAKKLASDFDYVRVDLYNVDGEIYFGELTFAHGSGYERFSDKKYDILLGKYWR